MVSFPGTLIGLPFKLAFTGIEKTIAFVDETYVIQRVNDWLESDDGRRKLVPTYESRSGGGIKLHFKHLLNPESKLTLTAAVGMHQRQRYQLNFHNLKLGDWDAAIQAQYKMLSDESFFGIGPESDFDDASHYAHEIVNATASFGRQIHRTLALDAVVGFEQNSIEQGKEKGYTYTTDLIHKGNAAGYRRIEFDSGTPD